MTSHRNLVSKIDAECLIRPSLKARCQISLCREILSCIDVMRSSIVLTQNAVNMYHEREVFSFACFCRFPIMEKIKGLY